MVTLVIGGVRSGKSRWAMMRAGSLSARPVYVATSRQWDDDHSRRIDRHRAERGPEWTTIEEPVAIGSLDLAGRVVVVDCLTLWLANLFFDAGKDSDAVLSQAMGELDRLVACSATWFIVTNELGQGVHGDTEVCRKFVDLQGFTNQHAATLADTVVLMVAGIPVSVKGNVG